MGCSLLFCRFWGHFASKSTHPPEKPGQAGAKPCDPILAEPAQQTGPPGGGSLRAQHYTVCIICLIYPSQAFFCS
ncbi:MAG: hypothetical protein WAX13_04380, partial [Gemmiger qucibialis]